MNNRERAATASAVKRRIRRLVFWGAWWGVALVGVLLALPVAGQDAASQVQAEVERLQQLLARKPISFPGNPNANQGAGDTLKSARKDQSAGRLYRSLEEFGQVTDFVHGAWTIMDKADAVKSGLPAFEAEWEKASAGIAALDRQTRTTNWSDSPAALQALSETAEAMTMPLLEGGRGFAVSTEPKDGLFNIGEAQGQAEFAAFVASLRLPLKGAAYPLRSLLPELASLQQKVNAAFQPPRSIDLHVQFMLINSGAQASGGAGRNEIVRRGALSVSAGSADTMECSMLLRRGFLPADRVEKRPRRGAAEARCLPARRLHRRALPGVRRVATGTC